MRNQRCARVRDKRDCLPVDETRQQPWPRLGGIVLMIGREGRRYPVTINEFAGNAGIFRGDYVYTCQHFERAQRDVAEISDRRGYQIEAGLGFGGVHRTAKWSVSARSRFALVRHGWNSRRPVAPRHVSQFSVFFAPVNFRATISTIPVTT